MPMSGCDLTDYATTDYVDGEVTTLEGEIDGVDGRVTAIEADYVTEAEAEAIAYLEASALVDEHQGICTNWSG